MPKGRTSATTPWLTNQCRTQTASWALPFSKHSVPGCAQMENGVLKNEGHWSLQKMPRGIGIFPHFVFPLMHKAEDSLVHPYCWTERRTSSTLIEVKKFQCSLYPSRVSALMGLVMWWCCSLPSSWALFLKASSNEVWRSPIYNWWLSSQEMLFKVNNSRTTNWVEIYVKAGLEKKNVSEPAFY